MSIIVRIDLTANLSVTLLEQLTREILKIIKQLKERVKDLWD